jgi:Helix-hairpin-helix domain
MLASVPGIDPVLARRLHHDLGIDTLEELEASAYNGRLTNLAGIGSKRLAGIIDSLSAWLGPVRGGTRAARPLLGEQAILQTAPDQWTKPGADLLLQSRVKTMNWELGVVLQCVYPELQVEEGPQAV